VLGPDLSSSPGRVEWDQTASLRANDTPDHESAREAARGDVSGEDGSAGLGGVEAAEDAPTRTEEPPADGAAQEAAPREVLDREEAPSEGIVEPGQTATTGANPVSHGGRKATPEEVLAFIFRMIRNPWLCRRRRRIDPTHGPAIGRTSRDRGVVR
jgi:hypothetical protein